MPHKSSPVHRFHEVLVDEIRRTAPEYLNQPFTVAEIYQSLIPYRTHRDRLGVEQNGDYEAMLLRLLGGEGELLELESEAAQSRIRRELEGKNPNTGLYREYAAVQVRLVGEELPAAVEEKVKEPKRAEPSLELSATPAPVDGESPDACPDCNADLPDRDTLRFCPFCGTNVFIVPCGECGEVLEREWLFCVACGTPTGD